jgi:hypothetical protein
LADDANACSAARDKILDKEKYQLAKTKTPDKRQRKKERK